MFNPHDADDRQRVRDLIPVDGCIVCAKSNLAVGVELAHAAGRIGADRHVESLGDAGRRPCITLTCEDCGHVLTFDAAKLGL